MFDNQQDWTWRFRLNLIVTAGFAVLALVLLFWRPEADWGRTLGHVSVGGVGAGIGLHLALFRRPRAIDPAQLRRIEATALRDARQVMLWAWAIAILWTGSWLMAGIDSGLGLPVGGLLFVLSLPLLLFALPVFWRDLRRDGLGVWHSSLNDEATRQFRTRADSAAMQAGLSVVLILSALSYLGIWPLAGHELGYLTAGAMMLTQITRRWRLERDAHVSDDD